MVRDGWRTAAVIAPLLVFTFAAPALADIDVHVVNCTTGIGMIASFDAKDNTHAVPAHTKKMGELESHKISCAGQGKGHCQIRVCSNTESYEKGSTSCRFEKVDSGDTLYVVDWESMTNKPTFADAPNQRCPGQ